jgi:hypothetical protein
MPPFWLENSIKARLQRNSEIRNETGPLPRISYANFLRPEIALKHNPAVASLAPFIKKVQSKKKAQNHTSLKVDNSSRFRIKSLHEGTVRPVLSLEHSLEVVKDMNAPRFMFSGYDWPLPDIEIPLSLRYRYSAISKKTNVLGESSMAEGSSNSIAEKSSRKDVNRTVYLSGSYIKQNRKKKAKKKASDSNQKENLNFDFSKKQSNAISVINLHEIYLHEKGSASKIKGKLNELNFNIHPNVLDNALVGYDNVRKDIGNEKDVRKAHLQNVTAKLYPYRLHSLNYNK